MKKGFQGFFLLFLCITWCYKCKAYVVNAKVDLITQTCKKTAYFDLCVKTLRANSKSADTDVNGLATIIFEEALSYSKTTYTLINDLITRTTDKGTKDGLDVCASLYQTVSFYSIPEVIKLLKVRPLPDYSSIESITSGVGTDAVFCDDGLNDETKKSPLPARNKFLDLLSRIAVEIVESMH